MIKRLDNWEERLDAFLLSVKDQKFEYGKTDCVKLCAGAVEAISGINYLDKLELNYSSALSAMRVSEKLGGDYETAFNTVCDKIGFQKIHKSLCENGDFGIILRGNQKVGAVFVSGKWVVFGEEGMLTLSYVEVLSCWRVGEHLDETYLRANFDKENADIILAMAIVMPIVAGIAGSLAGFAAVSLAEVALTSLVGQIIFTVVSTIVTVGLSFLGNMLFPADTPKLNDKANRGDLSRSFIQPLTTQKIVYGRTKVGGPIVYFLTRPPESTDYTDFNEKDADNEDMLHLVIVLAGHQVEAIEEIYLDSNPVNPDDSGYGTKDIWTIRNHSAVKVDKRLGGSDNNTAIAELVTKSSGKVYASIIFNVRSGQYIEDGAWVEIAGTKVYMRNTVTNANLESLRSDDLSDTVSNLAACLEASTDANINKCTYEYKDDVGYDRNKVRIRVTYDGDEKIEIKTSKSPKSFAGAPKNLRKRKWTNAHLLKGLAYIHVRLQYDDAIFPSGIPNISAITKGALVYDPTGRSTHPEWTTSTTYKSWTDNPARIILDYLMAPYGLGAKSREIDWTNFQSAINSCGIDSSTTNWVYGRDGVLEKRYTCNGVVDLAATPQEILTSLLTSCAGRLIFTGGVWKLYIGMSQTPVGTLSEDDLRGSPELTVNRSMSELINTVSGSIVSPDNDWQPTDYPVVDQGADGTDYQNTYDSGTEYRLILDLPFTLSDTQAQRTGRIALEENRRQQSLKFPANMKGFNFRAGDWVYVNLSRFGFVNKKFRVDRWQVTEDFGVDMVLQQVDSGIYTHNPAYLKPMEKL